MEQSRTWTCEPVQTYDLAGRVVWALRINGELLTTRDGETLKTFGTEQIAMSKSLTFRDRWLNFGVLYYAHESKDYHSC